MATLHDHRYPNESAEYRDARNALLEAEIALRRQTEAVAAMRRALPPGGRVEEDYVFEQAMPGQPAQVRLSELFSPGQDTLVLYNFMYGPNMKQACPSCTSILDAIDDVVPHARQRIGVAAVARSPLERLLAYAQQRGWRHLRLLSSANNAYNADYHGETAEGSQMPMLNVFTRRDGELRHFYGTELMFTKGEDGQDPRHVDPIWPLWHLLDYTPEGRGDWRPALSY
ncbi:DUF899 family protein [Cupriavidus plantarum]|uniref:DUF899 family protein n=1 Tax=Cupriavidus plantarum TaxID=942865 RepID=UPI00339D9B9D